MVGLTIGKHCKQRKKGFKLIAAKLSGYVPNDDTYYTLDSGVSVVFDRDQSGFSTFDLGTRTSNDILVELNVLFVKVLS